MPALGALPNQPPCCQQVGQAKEQDAAAGLARCTRADACLPVGALGGPAQLPDACTPCKTAPQTVMFCRPWPRPSTGAPQQSPHPTARTVHRAAKRRPPQGIPACSSGRTLHRRGPACGAASPHRPCARPHTPRTRRPCRHGTPRATWEGGKADQAGGCCFCVCTAGIRANPATAPEAAQRGGPGGASVTPMRLL